MVITDVDKLRIKCEDVSLSEVDSIRTALEGELKRSEGLGRPGIGLSAPQIGVAKNMAIIRVVERGNVYNLDLVNCRIAEGYDPFDFDDEACLSFPGLKKKTRRYSEIYVVDNLVEPHRFIVTGIVAIVCQHELDHLKGILLVDK
jgi:peptide deformylase